MHMCVQSNVCACTCAHMYEGVYTHAFVCVLLILPNANLVLNSSLRLVVIVFRRISSVLNRLILGVATVNRVV